MPIEPEEIGRLLDRYWAVLVHWVGGQRDDAEDIVQSAFIKLASEDPIPRDPPAWLFTVSKRMSMNDSIARKKRQQREADAGRRRITITQTPNIDNQGDVDEMLSTLTSLQREIVVAKVWGNLTFDEIGATLGQSKATVWRTYQTAIAELQSQQQSKTNG